MSVLYSKNSTWQATGRERNIQNWKWSELEELVFKRKMIMIEDNRKQQQQQRTTENTTVLADLNRGGSEMCLGACAVQKELFEKMII